MSVSLTPGRRSITAWKGPDLTERPEYKSKSGYSPYLTDDNIKEIRKATDRGTPLLPIDGIARVTKPDTQPVSGLPQPPTGDTLLPSVGIARVMKPPTQPQSKLPKKTPTKKPAANRFPQASTGDTQNTFLTQRKINHRIINNIGDGHCFYRALAQALPGTTYISIKEEIASNISLEDWIKYAAEYSTEFNGKRDIIHNTDMEKWRKEWPNEIEWATSAMIQYAMKYVAGLKNVAILIVSDTGITCPLDDPDIPGKDHILLLNYTKDVQGNGKHYELIELKINDHMSVITDVATFNTETMLVTVDGRLFCPNSFNKPYGHKTVPSIGSESETEYDPELYSMDPDHTDNPELYSMDPDYTDSE